ncbi:substrate-binding periplasmic protein [Sodalis sp. RH21]|uniref:substrate-binding periplasmic protein n=1 Tax=unclassified Sodalis (in: enterobacteria) TaxID=2636512 RepID=UPI0039B54213
MDKILSKGELRVCWAEDNPYSYKNPSSGKWEGFYHDMASDLATAMEVKLIDVDSTFKTIVGSVKNNECDIGGAALFDTIKRAEVVLFTAPISYETSGAFVKNDSPYKTYADLDQKGKVIISKTGSASGDFAKRFFKNAELKFVASDNSSVVAAEVANGRADAWWVAYTSTSRMLQENKQFNMRPLGDQPLNRVGIVWIVNLNEYHLQQVINVWLRGQLDSGRTAELWKKWFGTEFVH